MRRPAWHCLFAAKPLAPPHRAFTLLEMLIVIVILGVLAAVIVPRFTVSAAEAKKNACARIKAQINTMVELWYFRKGKWPKANLSDIGADPEYSRKASRPAQLTVRSTSSTPSPTASRATTIDACPLAWRPSAVVPGRRAGGIGVRGIRCSAGFPTCAAAGSHLGQFERVVGFC